MIYIDWIQLFCPFSCHLLRYFKVNQIPGVNAWAANEDYRCDMCMVKIEKDGYSFDCGEDEDDHPRYGLCTMCHGQILQRLQRQKNEGN